jgi:HlyD family secretion protein
LVSFLPSSPRLKLRQAPQTVQSVITYDVDVGVDNAARLLMPDMTAAARIITQRRGNVLRAPGSALHGDWHCSGQHR